MANYDPVRPAAGAVAQIPPLPTRTLIVANGGTVLISTDAEMDRSRAIPLPHGQAHIMPANATWICTPESGVGAEIRRMDYA